MYYVRRISEVSLCVYREFPLIVYYVMAGACEQKLHFCILFINLKEWLCCAEVRKCRNKEKFSVKVYWSTGHGQGCRMK